MTKGATAQCIGTKLEIARTSLRGGRNMTPSRGGGNKTFMGEIQTIVRGFAGSGVGPPKIKRLQIPHIILP